VKTAEDLKLPVPDVRGTKEHPGTTENVSTPRSDELADYIADLGQRAKDVAERQGGARRRQHAQDQQRRARGGARHAAGRRLRLP
jgi:hypothetical protein